jgi:predicted dehydrogenase
MAIRVVVLGLGRRGREWVGVLRTAPGFELVGTVEPDPAARRAAVAAVQLPDGLCHDSLDAAIEAGAPEAAIVATSIDSHVEPCRAALARGLGVLVEKPFALSLRDARGLVAEAQARRVPLMVGQNYRYMRMPRTLRRLFASGQLGRIGVVVVQVYRNQKETSRALATLPNSVLWEILVHHLDMLRHALGRRPVRVLAQRFTLPWSDAPPGASLQLLLEFEDGPRASLTATYDVRGHEFFERGQEFYLRAVSARGALHVFHRWLVWCERGRLPRILRRGPRPEVEELTLLRQLGRALTDGTEPESSGRDNLQTMALLEACARSAAEERWINPQDLLDEPI